MKTKTIMISGLILMTTGLFAEPQKSRSLETGSESKILILDQASTNETLYSRLKAGELIYWQYGVTNATTAVATPATSTTKPKVQVVDVSTVSKRIMPHFDPEQLRNECFTRSKKAPSSESYSTQPIAQQWFFTWSAGTEAPQGALVWWNF